MPKYDIYMELTSTNGLVLLANKLTLASEKLASCVAVFVGDVEVSCLPFDFAKK